MTMQVEYVPDPVREMSANLWTIKASLSPTMVASFSLPFEAVHDEVLLRMYVRDWKDILIKLYPNEVGIA